MQNNLSGRLVVDLDGSSITKEEISILQNPHVGGVILFSRNIASRQQVQILCHEIRTLNPSLLIAVDQEGGRVQRLKHGYTILPTMQRLAQHLTQDSDEELTFATDLGWLMASEVIASGLDISFAPVLDLDLSNSSIIGDRSFGDIPQVVIEIANFFIDGMNEAGMQAIGKHFPGHGGIESDSHLEHSIDNRTLQELKQHDLLPFDALKHKLGGIMTAHISFPQIEDDIVTFSQFWISDMLKGEMGYNGIIFTDDLSMKGTDYIGKMNTKVQKSLEAGCDMILVCNNRSGVYEAIDFLETNSTTLLRNLMSFKASHPTSWDILETDPRRADILEKIDSLNKQSL